MIADDDIQKARTLPSSFYLDHPHFYLHQKEMFRSSWHWVGRMPSEIQLQPKNILDGYLDMPVLLSRGDDEHVRAFANVCTHRASLLCKEAGKAREIICPYHGRRFNLDGQFLHMPGFRQVLDFPESGDSLHELDCKHWNAFSFIANQPDIEFSEWIRPVYNRMSFLSFDAMIPDTKGFTSYELQAHWALYVDNYLEGFHIPFVHPGLNSSLDVKAYEQHIFPYGTLQIGIGGIDTMCFDLPETSPDFGKRVAAYYFWLFPNVMLNFYPWGLSVNRVEPLQPALTRIQYETYVLHADLQGQGAGGNLNKVESEDQAIVEGVQKGIASGFYHQGRFSPDHEIGVHHFHRLLAKRFRL
jgi:choline monooxygenase